MTGSGDVNGEGRARGWWPAQVVELQKHLEQERQLRKASARFLEEARQALTAFAASAAQQSRVLAEANRLQVTLRSVQPCARKSGKQV